MPATWSSARPTRRCSPTSPTAPTGSRWCSSRRPDSQPKFYGFSPEPKPQLIAWRNTRDAGDRAVEGARSRPRGRRDRRPDRGLRPHRLAPVHLERDEALLPEARRQRLYRHRRCANAGFQGGARDRGVAGSEVHEVRDECHPLPPSSLHAVLVAAVRLARRRLRRRRFPRPPSGTALPYQSADKSVGVVNCASSLCHGSVRPFKDSNVLQTEYVTWSRVDKHARAYQVLWQRAVAAHRAQPRHRGADAGEGLPRLPRAQRARGAARGALQARRRRLVRGLPRPGRPLARVARRGRRDARPERRATACTIPASPSARARLCLSCHFGNADRFVTHRIMAAGHPRMSFELDTFTAVEPAHFKVDSDWEKRKRMWDGVQVWAIGQAIAVSGIDGRARRSEAQPRRPVPGARPVRLPRLPSSDERQALGAARPGPRPGCRAPQRFVDADGPADRQGRGSRLRRASERDDEPAAAGGGRAGRGHRRHRAHAERRDGRARRAARDEDLRRTRDAGRARGTDRRRPQRPVSRLRGRRAGDDGDRKRGELHVPARDHQVGERRQRRLGRVAARRSPTTSDTAPRQFQTALRNFRGVAGL